MCSSDLGALAAGEMSHPFLDRAKVSSSGNLTKAYERAAKKLTSQIYAKHAKDLPDGIAGQLGRGIMSNASEGLISKAKEYGKTTAVSGSTAGDPAVKAAVRKIAEQMGWDKYWGDIDWLVNKESSWNPKAANPSSSARGLFQKMTSIHGPVEKTAGGQANWGLNYIKGRYGTPVGAMNFHKRKGYYANGGLVTPTLFDRGGVLNPGTHLVANKTKKPEYILPAKVTDALMDGSATNSSAPIIQVTTPVVERNEVDEWTDKVRFAFNHMSKTSAFSGVNG